MNEPGVRTIDTIAAEINGIKEQVRATVVSGAIEIGRRLKEAKSLVPYGEWGAWLERSVDYSERTAQNMMRIADEYGKTDPQALADLSVTQAVLLLGVPAEERGAFLAEKPSGRRWPCVHATGTLYAGYPHFHFYANPAFAANFLAACRKEKHCHA